MTWSENDSHIVWDVTAESHLLKIRDHAGFRIQIKSENKRMASSEIAIQIDRFFADHKVQRLLNLARETRPLRVCFPREIPISRFLAWIFDPWQGHGLQDTPLRRLLTAAGRNAEDAQIELQVRRHLGPAFLATYSFMGCIVEK